MLFRAGTNAPRRHTQVPYSGPIAIGEVLRRIACRAVCFQFRSAFAAHFPHHQFAGVNIQGGVEQVVLAVRAAHLQRFQAAGAPCAIYRMDWW